jgi:sRNA-binding carbon storage regulator CsrA
MSRKLYINEAIPDGFSVLSLKLRFGESLSIEGVVKITVSETTQGSTRLSICAPKSVRIDRVRKDRPE